MTHQHYIKTIYRFPAFVFATVLILITFFFCFRGSSDIPSMRNWPLFAFLTGLVFFFYVFYVYQAQSTEFAMTRTELEEQIQKVRNLKMEVFSEFHGFICLA